MTHGTGDATEGAPVLAARHVRLARSWTMALAGSLAVAANAAPPRPVNPADFGWDLSYAAALAAHPVSKDEFLPTWIRLHARRPVHTRFASYAGDPILGTLLIEEPDRHAGDPLATWVVRTRTAASVCTFHAKFMDRPCESVGTGRADAFLRKVMSFEPSRAQTTEDDVIGKDDQGAPIRFSQVGFLSVWVDGRSLQRPISAVEMAPPQPPPASTGDTRDPARAQLAKALAELRGAPSIAPATRRPSWRALPWR